jgi:putative restriction endonuclease
MADRPLDLSAAERRYATRQVRQRLHQRMFRARVVAAYRHRCVLTGLPVAGLVDAAHIGPDLDAELGQPDVRNGVAMSRLHHAAFDGNLIGIDSDYRVHVAPALREAHDGPLLDLLKGLDGQDLRSRLPTRRALWPGPQRLEARFQRFRENALI